MSMSKEVIGSRVAPNILGIIKENANKANHTISQEVERLIKVALVHEKKLTN